MALHLHASLWQLQGAGGHNSKSHMCDTAAPSDGLNDFSNALTNAGSKTIEVITSLAS